MALILTNLSLSVVGVQCFTLRGRANRRRKLPRLCAKATSYSRARLFAKP